MTSFLLGTVIDTLRLLVIAAAVAAPLLGYRRTRRVLVTMVRLTVRKSPRWARPLIIAAQFFPGQLDDVAVFALVLVPILRTRHNRAVFARAARYAWHS